MTRRTRRLVLLSLALLVAVALGYSAWLAWQVRAELASAQAGITRLQDTLGRDDADADRERAVADLTEAAAGARDLTDGAWWSAMTWTPVVGDDAAAVRALSSSLAGVSEDGLSPLLQVADRLPEVQRKGRIDLEAVAGLQRPIARSRAAFDAAAAEVADIDTADLAGSVRGPFQRYVAEVDGAASAMADAQSTVDLLPGMLGADGPRDYLLVFQNNAEIRATGGLPGSWSLVHAEDGRLSIQRQGSARDFPVDGPVLPLSPAERRVYGPQLASYWLDAGFTPDFPRAAELMTAHWNRAFPDQPIDGVLALDPVTLSYLLEGTGPVDVGPVRLTTENVLAELLDVPYRTLDPAEQDIFFASAAAAVFERATQGVDDPLALVGALRRAAGEGRLLVSLADDEAARALEGTRLLGALEGDDGTTPHVDISLNDGTGSKMSYYLRYTAGVEARSCQDGRQQLAGTLKLRQTIDPAVAKELPDYVTGGGNFGTQPGSQLVFVRFHAPFGGSVGEVRLGGRKLRSTPVEIDGREVATFVALLSSQEPSTFTWQMETGPGQTGDVELGMTPSVVPGDNNTVVTHAC